MGLRLGGVVPTMLATMRKEKTLAIKAAGISHVHVVAIMPARVLVTTTSTKNVSTPNCDRSPSSPDMNGEPPNAKRKYPKKKMMKE